MLLTLRAIILVIAGTINAFCLTLAVRRWILQQRVEHALALGMHASRFILAVLWIAIVQGICTTGTPAGNVALLGMAVSFLALTIFALLMAIKGI